ncbi:MAG: protein TolQ [Rhizobiales bacterium]|nr:protein TolQ [Hyphomicrobiales bacterium]
MNPDLIAAQSLAAPVGELSMIGLFWQADIVVKVVMIGLLATSIWCWTIVFEKLWSLRRAKRHADRFERTFWSGQSLDELYQANVQRPGHAMAALFVAAMREWRRSLDMGAKATPGGVQLRVQKVMEVTIQRQMEALERRLLFLATVGSTAPFVGLFGTVWGIMNSFTAIAVSKNTNLSVVAPGIAEALFATALGLLAAIPAVIFYNKFSSDLARFGARLEGFGDEFLAIMSRQLEERD